MVQCMVMLVGLHQDIVCSEVAVGNVLLIQAFFAATPTSYVVASCFGAQSSALSRADLVWFVV